MNCADVELRLIEWIYGELSDEEQASLEEHLGECDACRRQGDRLRRDRQLLEAAPAAPGRVDLDGLYRRAAARSERRGRRWRRLAWAASAAVVLMAVLVLGRLRIECHAGYLVLSWGGTAEPEYVPVVADDVADRPEHDVEEAPAAVASSVVDPWPTLRQHAQRLATLDELVQLVVAELDSTDHRHRQELAVLERRLKYLQQQTASRWDVLDRDVRAVYQLAQHSPETERKGAQP